MGLFFAALATGAIVFECLLGLRKRYPASPLGRVKTWVNAHVWLGLLAFFILQERQLQGHGLTDQWRNRHGALGVILSLLFGASPVNWPAFMMEVAWVLISGYGIARGMRLRRDARRGLNQPNP